MLRLDDAEYQLVQQVAARFGMAPGAWIADVAVRYARGEPGPVPRVWSDLVTELLRFRVDLVRVGSLINQVARVANATGRLDHQASGLLRVPERMLGRVDDVLAPRPYRPPPSRLAQPQTGPSVAPNGLGPGGGGGEGFPRCCTAAPAATLGPPWNHEMITI